MPKRETLTTILGLIVIWLGISFGSAAIPNFFPTITVVISIITAIGLSIYGVVYFHQKPEKTQMIDAKKYFCKWFNFFPDKWLMYKKLIKSRRIEKTEIEQPNTIADQLRHSFQDLQPSGFKIKSEIEEEIKGIITLLDTFGFDLRQSMPRIRQHSTAVDSELGIKDIQGDTTIKDFIRQGEAIVKAIKKASEDVEKALEIK